MNNAYGERHFNKRTDDARLAVQGKSPLYHHPSLPTMPPSYGHVPAVPCAAQSSLTTSAAGGRSHSCSSPGSSASSICSTGMSMGGSNDACVMYGDSDYPHSQPPPLINPRTNHHRYANQPNTMSPVAPYSPGSQSSNPSLMSSPLPFGSAASAQTSSPSGSVSSSTDFVTLSSSPSVPTLDPAYKSVLQFVNQRWKAVQEKQAKNASSSTSNSSTFSEVPSSPAVAQQTSNSPSVSSSTSIARCTAPPQTTSVP